MELPRLQTHHAGDPREPHGQAGCCSGRLPLIERLVDAGAESTGQAAEFEPAQVGALADRQQREFKRAEAVPLLAGEFDDAADGELGKHPFRKSPPVGVTQGQMAANGQQGKQRRGELGTLGRAQRIAGEHFNDEIGS